MEVLIEQWCEAWSWSTFCLLGTVLFSGHQFSLILAGTFGIFLAWLLHWVRQSAWAEGSCWRGYEATGVVTFFGWVAAVGTVFSALGYAALSEGGYTVEGWTRTTEEQMLNDAGWLRKTFVQTFDSVKASGLEDLSVVYSAEQGGNRLPVTKSETLKVVESAYTKAALEFLAWNYPMLSGFTKGALTGITESPANTPLGLMSQDPASQPVIAQTIHGVVRGTGEAARTFLNDKLLIHQMFISGTAVALQGLSFFAITISALRKAWQG